MNRLGRLRLLLTPQSGLVGQSARYVISGAFVAAVYLLSTTFLAVVVGLPFALALPIGFAVQLCVHFTLQRFFVWVHDEMFALRLRHQLRRYLTVAAVQFSVTLASTSLLPGAVGLATEDVYLITAISLAGVNFLLFRYVVFHAERERRPSASREEELLVDAANGG